MSHCLFIRSAIPCLGRTQHAVSINLHSRGFSTAASTMPPIHKCMRLQRISRTSSSNLSRAKAAGASSARQHASSSSSASESPGNPQSAANLVWGLPSTVKPLVHVVTHPQLSTTQIVPLAVDSLHPDHLTKNAFTEFLAQSLISRAAKRQGTIALVLSAAYLPSQLEVMQDLAGKQPVDLAVFRSKDGSAMHAVFLKQAPAEDSDQQQQLSTEDLMSALEAALGPLQPLADIQLQLGRMMEGSLRQQLRLWDAATWSSVLQQKLESNNRVWSFLAVRSLRGPPSLQAAQKLVAKKGLYWVEVPEDDMLALPAKELLQQWQSSASSDSPATTASRRRNRGRGAAGAGAGVGSAEEQQGGGGGLVVVIGTGREPSVEEAAQVPLEAFTDYDRRLAASVDVGGGPANNDGDSSPRWSLPKIFG